MNERLLLPLALGGRTNSSNPLLVKWIEERKSALTRVPPIPEHLFVEKDWHELMLVDETASKCTSNLDQS